MNPKASILNGPAVVVGALFKENGKTRSGWALPGGSFTTSRECAESVAWGIRNSIIDSRKKKGK